jgi:hypothetical protein
LHSSVKVDHSFENIRKNVFDKARPTKVLFAANIAKKLKNKKKVENLESFFDEQLLANDCQFCKTGFTRYPRYRYRYVIEVYAPINHKYQTT